VACFDGGNFILGGLILKEQKYVDFGLALVNGCNDIYISTLTGIASEVFRWVKNTTFPNDLNNPGSDAADAAFYQNAGFYMTDGNYILRPEF
jgi:mannosyl-oligosaccharide alpha-1,2-mannosidase